MEVWPGRYTADIEGDFVVFLIGMRFNHPLRVRKWLPWRDFESLDRFAAVRIGAAVSDEPPVAPY